MGHAEGSRESQPKTGHAGSVSLFSENFLSSLQGRAESRLTEARFSQGRGRAGQVPGSAGFLVCCLSPPGGRAFIFSTPGAQNLGACPAGARQPESCGQVVRGRAKGPGLTRVSLVGAEDYGQCPADARRVSSTTLPTKNLPAHFGLAASILRRALPFGKPSPPLAESRFSYA